MSPWRIAGSPRRWPEAIATAGVVLVPLATVLAVARGDGILLALDPARSIVLGCAGLVTGVLLHLHGRLGTNDQSTWASVGIGGGGVLLLVQGACDLAWSVREPFVMSALSTGTALLITLGFVARAAGRTARSGALGTGIPLVAVLLVAQQTANRSGRLPEGRTTEIVALTASGALAVALAAGYLRLRGLPVGTRRRLAATALLTGSSLVLGTPQELDGAALTVLALALAVGASYLSMSAGVAMLGQVVHDSSRQVDDLRSKVASTEAVIRADQARLHEATTLVAGVSSACRLISELPASGQRDRLASMVIDELERLQRVLGERGSPAVGTGQDTAGPVDVDRVVERIALAHRTRGHRVAAVPSGAQAHGNADDMAEVLDILVENAALHGSPDDITITVEERHADVEIVVTDHGPGVPPQERDALFEWGTRRPGSGGQGIGLYAADALARGLGGTLRLDPSDDPGRGARFVLNLPTPPEGALPRGGLTSARR